MLLHDSIAASVHYHSACVACILLAQIQHIANQLLNPELQQIPVLLFMINTHACQGPPENLA